MTADPWWAGVSVIMSEWDGHHATYKVEVCDTRSGLPLRTSGISSFSALYTVAGESVYVFDTVTGFDSATGELLRKVPAGVERLALFLMRSYFEYAWADEVGGAFSWG